MLFRSIILSVFVCMPGLGEADSASIYDYRLGEHIIDYPLSVLDVISADLDGFAGQSFIKVNAPNETEVVLTFLQPDYTLDYLEHDWMNREVSAPTALGLPDIGEFTFGKTRVSDLQVAFGQQGFHYSCRQAQPIPGGFLTFVSFEIPERRNAVYTFVAEYSEDLVDRGMGDSGAIDLTQAVLIGAVVSLPSYPEEFWCDDRIEYTATHSRDEPQFPVRQTFADFLPPNTRVAETGRWEVVTDPFLMITKNGALTWGDRLFIMPDPGVCTSVGVMAWAHTYDDLGLMLLAGQDVDASFNLLQDGKTRVPFETPVSLANTLYAPINGRPWPPFAIGSFVFGPFDFAAIMAAESDPSSFGFSLEFPTGAAGMRDNYWSLEGLSDAGEKVIELCKENK